MRAQYFGAFFNEHIHDLPSIKEIFIKNFDEYSRGAYQAVRFFLYYSFFCFLSLGQSSDKILINNSIRIAFEGVNIKYDLFMMLGSLGLIVISVALHIFIHEIKVYENFHHILRSPFASIIENPFAKILLIFILYYLPPIILFIFSVKSRMLPFIGDVSFAISMIFAMVFMWLFWKQRIYKVGSKFKQGISISLIISIMVISVLTIENYRNSRIILQENASLGGRHFEGWNLSNLSAKRVMLERAHLFGAELSRSDLEEADLRGADLREAELRGADLRDTTFEFTNIQGANLTEVKNITLGQLQSAIVDESTKLPPQFKVVKSSGGKWTVEEVKPEPIALSPQEQDSSLRSE